MIFAHVSKGLPTNEVYKLSNFQEFVCLLLAPNEGLAYQLEVCQATISNTVLKWLKLADTRLSSLIHWPDRDALQKTMQERFKSSFGTKVAVILAKYLLRDLQTFWPGQPLIELQTPQYSKGPTGYQSLGNCVFCFRLLR